ncbi:MULTISPECIES: anthranilate synthase component I family protein [Bacillus]|uniref:Aminodeoxychorismate synthase component 1 n=1 Tax=Bacillus glycinifermentans TaxID=1664069 RepID=A0AAJ3YX24_9BACI|nr:MULTISPECIES: anthranilate synthase component I family protein [Bacillus]KKB72784.1 aminobenzoate synthetase [Bacillus sp. TH008]MDU0073035.1 anthranilate synthase component I family protein [Bacillus sp. IG6]MED8020771.1 anthranilate synthase component I family protein [Bacillus glycinifermentans]QAT63590.1 anthranilate synthase component I family protein [Bacillus glycinifermentans]WKB77456.1 anthranilate synthase component I family protein [Bacillus glycinifermentans]
MRQRRPVARTFSFSNERFLQRYEHLSKGKEHHVLLESARGGEYSIAGLDPVAIAKGKDGITTIHYKGETIFKEGDPFLQFTRWFQTLKTETVADFPDFQGGAVGFLSYDYARYIEKFKLLSIDDLQTPDLFFLVFDDLAVYDHAKEQLWLITHTEGDELSLAHEKLDLLEKMWKLEDGEAVKREEPAENRGASFASSFTEAGFSQAVEKIKQYIASGDVFQVNLSLRQSEKLSAPPFDVYKMLREVNPSPYMAYLETPDFQVICGSPELLIKKKGKLLETRPIAGTRSRGRDEAEDESLANELIMNEKERAEHVMLVDLERNDLGRVSKYGSVRVNEFMVIEKYSHVMHIVSNVCGEIRDECDAVDVIHAVFPGGTITGAPKVRTMEIIEELEPTRRGLYTGSIGWFGYNQDMHFNIVIRTIYVKAGHAFMQSGAGIVIDSNPKHEYKESFKKAIAMKKAIELSEEEKKEHRRVEK